MSRSPNNVERSNVAKAVESALVMGVRDDVVLLEIVLRTFGSWCSAFDVQVLWGSVNWLRINEARRSFPQTAWVQLHADSKVDYRYVKSNYALPRGEYQAVYQIRIKPG